MLLIALISLCSLCGTGHLTRHHDGNGRILTIYDVRGIIQVCRERFRPHYRR